MITALSFPFLSVYNSSAALFRSMEKTNVTMYVSLLMNAINVAGNAIGIFVLHAGVVGVAVPTLLSRVAAGLVMCALAFSRKNQVSVRFGQILAWDRACVRRILRIAVPNGIENGLFALGKVLVTSIVAMFGTAQIAANGVSNSVNQSAIIVVSAINLAMVTVVGQCVGANDYQAAQHYTKKLMKLSYLCTAVLGTAVCLCLPLLLQFYELSEETYRLTCILVVMHNLFAMALHPTSFNLSNSLRAAGDARFTMYVGIAMGADWLARSAAFVLRYKSGRWKGFRAV